MRVLLVEPKYYTKYPPLGLMKLASYHKSRGDSVRLVRGTEDQSDYDPDIVYITSLFTYAWKPVHKAIRYYSKQIPNAKLVVGGIYASLLPERIREEFPDINIHTGLHEEAEKYMPNYDILNDVEKWQKWNSSILFTSRGCIRKCPFCVVPKLEGKIRPSIDEIWKYIHPNHKQIILWDNNFLASPNYRNILYQLKETGLKIDFNQGLDARLITEENAQLIAELKTDTIRMAYDFIEEREHVKRAVNILEENGIRSRKILFYSLFNFYNTKTGTGDTPESFLEIIQDIANLGCVSYPMRYEPLDALEKNQFVSPFWTTEKIEAIADARRVIGFGGAFPPYKGLVEKFTNANDFDSAFELRPMKKDVKTDAVIKHTCLQESSMESCIPASGVDSDH